MNTRITHPQAAPARISGSGGKGFSERLRSGAWLLVLSGMLVFACTSAWAANRADEFRQVAVTLRANALRRISPKTIYQPAMPASPNLGFSDALPINAGAPYSWKYNITTTLFWVGEKATPLNPVSNEQSAWDPEWMLRYGGSDSPESATRQNYIPATFVPGLNPFYVALPYNDVDQHHTRPEAARVIPWFKSSFVRDGESVCKGHWVVIRHGNRVCYAQWQDVGPFVTDHWQYVFGNERPRPNANQDAGLDVSPAVHDYLGLRGMDHCDWKFVDVADVPSGPWSLYGQDNPFVRRRNQIARSHGGHGSVAGTAAEVHTADTADHGDHSDHGGKIDSEARTLHQPPALTLTREFRLLPVTGYALPVTVARH